MLNIRLKAGDIFSQQTEGGHYVFGRILLDLHEAFDNGMLDKENSTLSFFQDCYLVEGYNLVCDKMNFIESSKVIIPGMLINNFAVENRLWDKVSFKDVLPQQIDFPENLTNIDGQYCLVKGEIALPIMVGDSVYDKFQCAPTIINGSAFRNYVLQYMHRNELINPFWRDKSYLSESDLRFRSPALRSRIFEIADEDPHLSYYEMALKNGFDSGSLLEKVKAD